MFIKKSEEKKSLHNKIVLVFSDEERNVKKKYTLLFSFVCIYLMHKASMYKRDTELLSDEKLDLLFGMRETT